MERANYESWSTVEEISIPRAAYLWCDYEMPPDEPVIVEHVDPTLIMIERCERPIGGRIKGKSIPEKVKLVLFKLIQAAISGQLLLSDGRKLEAEKINPWSIPKTFSSIGPDTPNIFRNAITTKKRLREYAKSIGQQPKFLFPDAHQKKALTDSRRDEIIQNVTPGVDKIYDAMKALGFSGRSPYFDKNMSIDEKKIHYQKAAFEKLSEIETDYPLIKKEFLSPELFVLLGGPQSPRDFKGKLLKRILIDQGTKKPGAYATIYVRYNELKKVGR